MSINEITEIMKPNLLARINYIKSKLGTLKYYLLTGENAYEFLIYNTEIENKRMYVFHAEKDSLGYLSSLLWAYQNIIAINNKQPPSMGRL